MEYNGVSFGVVIEYYQSIGRPIESPTIHAIRALLGKSSLNLAEGFEFRQMNEHRLNIQTEGTDKKSNSYSDHKKYKKNDWQTFSEAGDFLHGVQSLIGDMDRTIKSLVYVHFHTLFRYRFPSSPL